MREDRVGENWLLHGNQQHAWYYIADQEEDDLIVSETRIRKGDVLVRTLLVVTPLGYDLTLSSAGASHAAFDSKLGDIQLRESLDLRIVAFRPDVTSA